MGSPPDDGVGGGGSGRGRGWGWGSGGRRESVEARSLAEILLL